MAEGYFERGEIYGIRFGDGIGSEEGYYRPGVIVSSDQGNRTSPTVNICYLTTQPKNLGINIETFVTGRKSWILTNQIFTADKTRIGKQLGTLTLGEIRELDEKLKEVLDLDYVDDTEIKAKEAENAALALQLKEAREDRAKAASEVESLKMEVAMFRRLYEKALDQICNMKLASDIARRTEPEKKKEVAPEKKPEPEPEQEKTDINSCRFDDLRKLGLSNNIVMNVINGRPYKSIEDLKSIAGMTAIMYKLLEPKICCVAVPEKKPEPVKETKPEPERKANVNTMTAKELQEILGIAAATCYSIVGYRKKHGAYEKLEDLLNVRNVFPGTLERLRDKLEV